MTPNLDTRKPVDQLRWADLAAFPVWEYAIDEEGQPGRDETWVRPLDTKVVPADSYSLSVAARFTTPTGKELRGIVNVTTAKSFEVTYGAILTESDYVFVPWPGWDLAKRACEEAARCLGLEESALFPLRYALLVPVEGVAGPVNGVYEYRHT